MDLITRADREPHARDLEAGVRLHALAAGRPGPVAKSDLAEISDEFGEAVAALAREAAPAFDIIHAHYWLSGIAALPVALEVGAPFVQSFHTLAAMKDRETSGRMPRESERRVHSELFLARQAAAIIAGSAAEATFLIDDVRAPADRVWVIPPGVDIDLFRPNREKARARVESALAIAPERAILCVAGRIQPLKDQELAIRILAELPPRHGARPILVIAGESTPGDEEYARGLRALAQELGVDGDVRFTGALSRTAIADLLCAATITLVTSHSETFGLTALESAASGTPVVGYRASGMSESIAEGVSGVLVDSRSPKDWADAVALLLDDSELLGELAASSRLHALGYTWASSATALLGVYSSL